METTPKKARRPEPRRADLTPEERERQQQVARDYHKAHRETRNEWHRNYRRDHPEVARAGDKRKRTKAKQEQPLLYLLCEVRRRARKRGIPFDLSVADLEFPVTCPILGIPLVFGVGHATDNSPSLDRLVPEKGYVRGNCFIISNKANRMKQDNTLEDFQRIVSYIEERLSR